MGLRKKTTKNPTSYDALAATQNALAVAAEHASSASSLAESEAASHRDNAAYFAAEAANAAGRKAEAEAIYTALPNT